MTYYEHIMATWNKRNEDVTSAMNRNRNRNRFVLLTSFHLKKNEKNDLSSLQYTVKFRK